MNIFRKIKDFEDYEVDNDGNVKSLRNDIIMKAVIDKGGYYFLHLSKHGKHYNKKVHRLVAEAFLPNPLGLPCVNHKDEIKTNNHIELELDDNGNIIVNEEKSNLEWCTVKYNNNYNDRQKRIAEKRKGVPMSEEAKAKMRGRKLSEEAKRKISDSKKGKPTMKRKSVVAVKNGEIIFEFKTITEVKIYGFNQGHVSECCRKCYHRQGNNFYKTYQWFFKSEWLQMQKQIASPHRREDAIQLELNLLL